MGYLQVSSSTSSSTSSHDHLYSQELQMKLYQAFIFSIPILFSIILFLLFYLFYLKRTFSTTSPSSFPTSLIPSTPSRSNQASLTTPQSNYEMGLMKCNLADKLIMISFDEDFSAKDSMCCVCLGEFEKNEKLQQIPSCRHVFHGDCIRNWLHSNSTCPLCRCLVISTKDCRVSPPAPPEPTTTISQGSAAQVVGERRVVVVLEGSSSTSMDNKLPQSNEEFIVVNIHQTDT